MYANNVRQIILKRFEFIVYVRIYVICYLLTKLRNFVYELLLD